MPNRSETLALVVIKLFARIWTVAVPKIPSIPRLSIVIPIGNDLVSFESTLISVLEHRPAGCEILVANDGRYDDPFDLGDEVRFVVGRSVNLIDLVSAGAAQSRARFVHVIADGVQATSGWIDGAIEKFEHHDAAVVAPVIRQATSKQIIAAGWSDANARLCDADCRGQQRIRSRTPRQVGAYLQASLWRRDVLVSLAHAFAGRDVVEASYAYEHLIRAAGWRCVLADQSDLLLESDQLPWDYSSAARGKRLRAIRSHFNRSGGWGHSIVAASTALAVNSVQPSRYAESLGQAIAPLAAVETKKMLRPSVVRLCNDEHNILPLPVGGQSRIRRAA